MTVNARSLEQLTADFLERIALALESLASDSSVNTYRRVAWLVGVPSGEREPYRTTPNLNPSLQELLMSQVTMTNTQHVAAALVLLDRDGAMFPALPAGSTFGITNSNPAVAEFIPDASGVAGEITSGAVGSTRITGRVTLPDGRVLEDVLDVSIVNSEAESVRFVVGTPTEESEPLAPLASTKPLQRRR